MLRSRFMAFLLGALSTSALGWKASRPDVSTVAKESISIGVGDSMQWHYGVLSDSVLGFTPSGRIYGKQCGVSRTFARPWKIRPASHDSVALAGDTVTVTVKPPCRVEVPIPPNPVPTDSLAEPVFDATTQTMLYAENFDAYTMAKLRPPCGTPVGSVLVDHSVAYCANNAYDGDGLVTLTTGRTGQAVKMSYAGVISAGGQEIHGWIVNNPGGQTGRKNTVVQYWMRFTSDSGTPLTARDANGSSSATIAIKNLMLWSDQNRFQWDFVNGPSCHHADGTPWYGPIGYTNITGIGDVYPVGCQSAQPVGPSLAEYGDGAWHRWTAQYQPMSVPGATDGIARLWIDGKLTTNLEKGACAVPPPTPGWKPWCDVAELAGLVGGTRGLVQIEWGGPRTDGGYTSKWSMIMDDLRWWVAK